MNSIRLKITIELNRNQALTDGDLQDLKPAVERGIAASLPDTLAIDAIKITSIKETSAKKAKTTVEETSVAAS